MRNISRWLVAGMNILAVSVFFLRFDSAFTVLPFQLFVLHFFYITCYRCFNSCLKGTKSKLEVSPEPTVEKEKNIFVRDDSLKVKQ